MLYWDKVQIHVCDVMMFVGRELVSKKEYSMIAQQIKTLTCTCSKGRLHAAGKQEACRLQ